MRYLLLVLLAGLTYAETVPGRYIVELTGEPAGRRAARRTAVRGEQSALRARLGARAAVMGSVDTVGNAIFVEADEAEAARLASLPGVRRVRPMRTYKLLLDRAVVVNGITEAWAAVGDDRAGEGIKIGIIDTGVDNAHAALRESGLTAPAGYPKTNSAADDWFTNGKVIVARSYVDLLARRDLDLSARDRVGHGTALAVTAAGMRTAGPLATIAGVAPRAYIGSYKVFGTPGVNDGATDAAILKAIDDAVQDGMDVINLSLGEDFAPRLEDDVLVAAVERAVAAGVLVVCAAGNNGPDFGTISTPATARGAIAVGATRNDRTFGASVEVEGVGPVLAMRSSGAAPEELVTGAVADVEKIDGNGLACETLPAGSLAGRIALILRGTCTFETKLLNAGRAGAAGAVVYAAADAPEPFTMGVGVATLPAEMVSHANGLILKARDGATVSLRFALAAVPQEAGYLTTFSAIGPGVDLAIKPDVVAVGGSFYTATQSFDPAGDMYSANGFVLVQGTSFSAPLAAGSLALLKAARPGLTVEQYRSLLVNTAAPLAEDVGVQRAGAGRMDVGAAVRSRVAVSPSTAALGGGPVTLRMANLGEAAEVYSVTVEARGGGAAPAVSAATLGVGPGEAGEVVLTLDAAGLAPGAYEGFVRVAGSAGEVRVPYWLGVKGGPVAAIPVLAQTATGRRGGTLRNAVYFRVTDAAGVPVEGVAPEVEAVEGGGSGAGVTSLDAASPGLFAASVRLGAGAGAQKFRIRAGDQALEVVITAQ